MKRERSFRPPQTVLDSVASAGFEAPSGPVPLSDLRLMYACLSEQGAFTKADQWGRYGGNEGLRWSRRILKQEGVLLASANGTSQIPDLVDTQLGPTIVAATLQAPVDVVTGMFHKEGIPGSFVQLDDQHTLAMFAGDNGCEYQTTEDSLNLGKYSLNDFNIVDDDRNKITTIHKAVGDGLAEVTCGRMTGPLIVGSLVFDKPWILKSVDRTSTQAQILKVDDSLGLVLGWAIICKTDGQPYFDTQGDHITESAMLDASVDFMLNSRMSPEMHRGPGDKGTVVFAWPMTEEIAKAYNITVNQTGLMIAIRVHDEAVLEKFRDGTYTGFSIGGSRIPESTEEVANG